MAPSAQSIMALCKRFRLALMNWGKITTHTIIVKQALNQVNMREHHAATAVAMQLELRERLAFSAAVNEQRKVRVPLVTDNLAAAKAANRNDLPLVQWRALTIARTGGAVTTVDRPAARKNSDGEVCNQHRSQASRFAGTATASSSPPWLDDTEWMYVPKR